MFIYLRLYLFITTWHVWTSVARGGSGLNAASAGAAVLPHIQNHTRILVLARFTLSVRETGQKEHENTVLSRTSGFVRWKVLNGVYKTSFRRSFFKTKWFYYVHFVPSVTLNSVNMDGLKSRSQIWTFGLLKVWIKRIIQGFYFFYFLIKVCCSAADLELVWVFLQKNETQIVLYEKRCSSAEFMQLLFLSEPYLNVK